jgi:hypothetical protein
VTELLDKFWIWQQTLTWSQALALVLFIVSGILFIFNWDVIDEEFGYARHQEDAEAKAKSETTRKLP